MKKNYWTVGGTECYATWHFKKFLDNNMDLIKLSEAIKLLKKLLSSINNYFEPIYIDITYAPMDSISNKHLKPDDFCRDRFKINNNLTEIFKKFEESNKKNSMIITRVDLYGKTLLCMYDENGKIIEKWLSNNNTEQLTKYYSHPDYLDLNISFYGNTTNPFLQIAISTTSDIWFEKVEKTRKVDENDYQHYENKKLARKNSKILSVVIEKIKEVIKPDIIDTYSDLDYEGAILNFPNKLVTECGINQKRIYDFWGDYQKISKMKRNYWQITGKEWYGTWSFTKFLGQDINAMRLTNIIRLLRELLPPLEDYFIPTKIRMLYTPVELIGKRQLTKEVFSSDEFNIRGKVAQILDKKLIEHKNKNHLRVNQVYVYGKTLLYVYDEKGKVVKKWLSSGDMDVHDYLNLNIECHTHPPKYPPKYYITIKLQTSSDIWLEKVDNVDDKIFQNYDNNELATLNSKTLSLILKSTKKTFNPDKIETWSEIDQEACEKNFPEKFVTERGFNQDRIKEIWGDRC